METFQKPQQLADLVSELVNLTKQQQLTEAERLLIKSSLDGTTQYRELAEQNGYSEKYLKNVGSDLWQLLTAVFNLGIKITKNNFSHVLMTHQARLQERVIQLRQFSFSKRKIYASTSSQMYGQLPRLDWFYGRKIELSTLKQQLSELNCINIYGQPGIGKSALVTRYLMEFCEFEYVIYQSLYDAPPLLQLIQNFQQLLPLHQDCSSLLTDDVTDSSIQHLIQMLKQHRCLLIFDDADQILLRNGSSLEPYPLAYQDYGKLIRQIVHSPHSSCLLLLSRIAFKDLEWMKSHDLSCTLFSLKGLNSEDARQILARQGIGTSSEQEQLAALYYGNPLLLQLVGDHILEQFNGDADEYLQLETTLAPDRFAHPIQQQLTHTTDLEREILVLLSLFPALTLTALLEKLESKASIARKSEVLEALKLLYQQALIERQVQPDSKVKFLLQPVMRKCVLKQFAPPVGLAS